MIPRKFFERIVVAVAGVLAIYAGSHLVTLSPANLALVTAAALVLLWTLLARDYWWTPLLVGATITGVFKIGFKLYPIDVASVLCLLGLAPLLMVHHEKLWQSHRRPLPFIFYLTALYITVRMSIDILPAQIERGTLGRVYYDAIWPFIFGWLFHQFGKLAIARAALVIVFLFLLARSAAAVVGFLMNTPLYIPGINYVVSMQSEESLIPMRSVAFNLLLVTLIFFHSSRSFVIKGLLLPVVGFSSWLMVMGASRFMTFMFLVLPVCFFAWQRKWILFIFATFTAAGIIIFANLSPQTIDQLPPMAARSLSGLIIRDDTVSEAKTEAQSSTDWHHDLRVEGFRRWTLSPFTFLFGYGMRPSPVLNDTNQYWIDPVTAITTSSNVGAYESGLWTVLALSGAVGFLLYFLLFLNLGRRVLPYFLRSPRGTFWEGILFWGCYSSFIWFATCHFQGSFPALEIFLIILAAATVDDIYEKKEPPRDAIVPSFSNAVPSAALGPSA